MKQFKVTIPDSKAQLFIEIMKSLSFVKDIEENIEMEIPEEHKSIVRERIEKYKNNTQDYTDWEDISQKINLD
ncbi:MAG: addiction module protein [Chlorobi bacterium]|nr:addiction module protein [Chlorobiota bacterium]